MAFTRLDKAKGFYPDNCAWLSKSEASKLNASYMKEKGTLDVHFINPAPVHYGVDNV